MKHRNDAFTDCGPDATRTEIHNMPVVEGVPTFSVDDLKMISRDLVSNARALYPGVPVAHLIGEITSMAEPEFLSQLDAMLHAQHFTQTGRAMRAEECAEERYRQLEADYLFPGIRENVARLPKRVDIGQGKKKDRAALSYEDLKRRLRVLDRRRRKRLETNAEATAIKALMKLWPPRSKKAQGTTLAEVDAMKARQAGLIA